MTNQNCTRDNFFGEEENEEIQYYDEAFPSLSNVNHCENGTKSIQFANNFSELSLVNLEKSLTSFVCVTDTFLIPFEELDSRSATDLHRLLADICSSCNVLVETNVSIDESLRVFIRGPKVKVMESKKRIMRLLQTQYEIVLDVPKEYHRNIMGTKGVAIKELQDNTGTTISLPKFSGISTNIIIKGAKDNIENCRQQIMKTVDELSKVDRQVIDVEKRYHQLVCHKSNTSLHVVVERKHLRLDIPPLSVDRNEISISGDREGVAQAASILTQTYNLMRSTYQELEIDIPKEKHRFIIGQKGSGIKDVLDKTGVWVDIVDSNSSDTVRLLGPKECLGSALTMVFVKSESVHTVKVSAPGWLHRFIIGKNGSHITELLSNDANIHLSFETDLNQIIVEGFPDEVEQISNQLKNKIFDLQLKLSLIEMEIDPSMIKHVIGSGGSNIQKIRNDTNCTIMFPRDPTKRLVTIVGKQEDVEVAKSRLMKIIEIIENTKNKDVIFKHEFLPKLIGQNGKGLREIREKYPEVRINVPAQDCDSDIIGLIGPRKDVDEVALLLQKKHNYLVDSSYSEKIKIPNKYHRLIIGREGIKIRDLTKSTNTRFQIPAPEDENDEIIIYGKKEDVEVAIKKVRSIYEKESNIIEIGIEIPKHLHTVLIGKGGNRITTFKESCGGLVTIRFPTLEEESNTVLIKGVKDEVFKAQLKMQELVNEVTSSNYGQNFPMTSDEYQFLFMSPDLKYKKLREVYKVRISELEDKSLSIVGEKKNVNDVIDLLTTAKSKLGPIVTDELCLNIDHVVYFERSGEINRIGRDHQCTVTVIPDNCINGSIDGRLQFKGPKRNITAAKAEIIQIVEDYESLVTDSIIVDERQFEHLKKFSNIQFSEISVKFKVRIEMPLYPEPVGYFNGCHLTSKLLDHCDFYGLESSYSEEDSRKCFSPNPSFNDTLSNDLSEAHIINEQQTSDTSDVNSEVSSTISTGINLVNGTMSKNKLLKYTILITGHKERIPLVKEEIFKLFILDLEVDVPEEYYPPLIGTKGCKINELRLKHKVDVMIPTKDSSYHNVIVSGSSDGAMAAKREIMELIADLEKSKRERLDRNCRVTVHVPLHYHTQLIGYRGENISKIRNKYTVRIIISSLENKSEEIVIVGQRSQVENAKNEIESFVHKLQSSIVEQLHIDSRLHSRLIGSRGANLDLLKKKYKVEILFPNRGTEGDDANIVNIKGTKDGVDKCADELITRANEMLDEMPDKSQSVPSTNHQTMLSSSCSTGFWVRDAPWNLISKDEDWANISDSEVVSTDTKPATWNQIISNISSEAEL